MSCLRPSPLGADDHPLGEGSATRNTPDRAEISRCRSPTLAKNKTTLTRKSSAGQTRGRVGKTASRKHQPTCIRRPRQSDLRAS